MDHNNGKAMKSMMWMMVICCGLPFLIILLTGAGGIAAGGSKWVVIGAVVLMVGAHIWMMRRGHGHDHGSEKGNESKEPLQVGGKVEDKKDEHKGHSCCH